MPLTHVLKTEVLTILNTWIPLLKRDTVKIYLTFGSLWLDGILSCVYTLRQNILARYSPILYSIDYIYIGKGNHEGWGFVLTV